jgi:hypothetical protein
LGKRASEVIHTPDKKEKIVNRGIGKACPQCRVEYMIEEREIFHTFGGLGERVGKLYEQTFT